MITLYYNNVVYPVPRLPREWIQNVVYICLFTSRGFIDQSALRNIGQENGCDGYWW